MSAKITRRFIPALGHRWLTLFYDSIVALTTRERTFKLRIVENISTVGGAEILDLRYDARMLAIWARRTKPEANVTGLSG